LISIAYLKDPGDSTLKDDRGVRDYVAFMKKYYPEGNPADVLNAYGYSAAQTLGQVLKQCGDDLSRENVMRQAANLKDLSLPMLIPGIMINTSPTDFYPIEQVQFSALTVKPGYVRRIAEPLTRVTMGRILARV